MSFRCPENFIGLIHFVPYLSSAMTPMINDRAGGLRAVNILEAPGRSGKDRGNVIPL